MALNNLGLGFVFTARDLASGVMRKVQGNFNRTASTSVKQAAVMKGAFAGIGGGVAAMTAGLGGLALAAGAANQFGEFEAGLKKVQAISRATEAELQLLKEAAIKAGIETQFSPTEATEGLSNLASQGFNARESISLLTPALDLAAGGQISIAEASATTASAVKVFGLSMDEAATAADKLLRISNTTSLKASDLGLAIGTVSRGAGLAGQSMEEMLAAMGLVKNTGVDASVAASGVSSSLIFMAKNADAFDKIGVKVTKANGKFRPLLDIIEETGNALGDKYPNDAKRAAEATKLFGRFGVSAFTGITKQINTGIKDAAGNILKGTDAIKFLRESLKNSGGAAKEFKDKMLSTFAGQKTLLKGTLQTLGVVAGEGFAEVFKPVVAGITTGLNFVIRLMTSMPSPLKKMFAGLFALASAFLAAGGATALLVAGFVLLLPALKVIGIAFVALSVAILPFIAAVVFAGIAIAGFFQAFNEDIGGLGKSTGSIMDKIRLGFDALGQLFEQGGFSGKVREEFAKAENEGLRNFAIKVFLIVNRVKNFLKGIGEGFADGVRSAKPHIESMLTSFDKLGTKLGFIGDKADAGDAKTKFGEWGDAGKKVGDVLSTAFSLVVRGIDAAISIGTGVVEVFSGMGPMFSRIGVQLTVLGTQFSALGAQLGLTNKKATESGSGWETLGQIVGVVFGVIGGLISAFTAAISISFAIVGGAIGIVKSLVLGLGNVFVGVVEIIAGAANGSWKTAWNGIKRVVFGVARAIGGVLGALLETIAKVVDSVAAIGGIKTGLAAGVRKAFGPAMDSDKGRAAFGVKEFGSTFDENGPVIGGKDQRKALATVSTDPLGQPSAAAAAQNQSNAKTVGSEVASALASMPQKNQSTSVTVQSQLVLDEEVLATAVNKVNSSDGATGFSPGAAPQG